MAISAIAPSEKAEHLIYTLLPVTLAIWFTVLLFDPEASSETALDPQFVLSVAAIAASFLAIILYEIRPDEYLVKAWYRRLWYRDMASRELTFLTWNLYFKTWEKAKRNPPELVNNHWDLRVQVEHNMQSVVSSQVVKRRLWPIRASCYLFCSVPFLLWTGFSILWKMGSSYVPALFVFMVPTTESAVLRFTIFFTVPFWVIQYCVGKRRQKNLKRHIRELAIFSVAQMLSSVDLVDHAMAYHCKKTEEYTKKGKLAEEIKFLHSVISKNDWTIFVDRWLPIRYNTEATAQEGFLGNFWKLQGGFYGYWGDHIKSASTYEGKRTNTLQAERNLGWYIHLANQLALRTSRMDGAKKKAVVFAEGLLKQDTLHESRGQILPPEGKASLLKFLLGRITLRARTALSRDSPKLPKNERLLTGLSNPLYILAKADDSVLQLPDIETNPLIRKIVEWSAEILKEKQLLSEGELKTYLEKLKEKRKEVKEYSSLILSILHAVFDHKGNGCTKLTGFFNLPERYHDSEQDFTKKLLEKLREWTDSNEWLFALALVLEEGNDIARLCNLEAWKTHLSVEPVRSIVQQFLNGKKEASAALVEKCKQLQTSGFLSNS